MGVTQRGWTARWSAPSARWVTGLAGLLTLVTLAARPVAAQGADGPPASGARPPHGWIPHLRLHVGAPQLVSLAVGGLRAVPGAADDGAHRGPLLLVEPGVRAGKVRVGYGAGDGVATGHSVTAVYLQAWGGSGPRWTAGGSGHAGVELHTSVLFMDAGVGAYRPVRGAGSTRVTFSVGVGL